MSIPQSRLTALVLFLAALWSYGCDANGGTVARFRGTGPSPVGFTGFGDSLVHSNDFFSRGVTFRVGTISAYRVFDGGCKRDVGLAAPVTIVTTGIGTDLFLNHLDMRFVDHTGVFRGSFALGPSELAERFGSTRIPPLGTRAFIVPFEFGCVGQPSGTLTVSVVARDGFGRQLSTSSPLLVR
jgi:hypothetical protein